MEEVRFDAAVMLMRSLCKFVVPRSVISGGVREKNMEAFVLAP